MPFSIHNYSVKFSQLHDEANATKAINKFCEKQLLPQVLMLKFLKTLQILSKVKVLFLTPPPPE
jgi:hypothetical protein